MKLRYKLALSMLLPILLVGLLLAYYNISTAHERLLQKDYQLIGQELMLAAEFVENGNLEAVTTVQLMATAQENGFFGQRLETVDFLRQILRENPQYIGVSTGYEPNADGQDASFLQEHGHQPWMGEDGRYLLYWFRDGEDPEKLHVESLVGMEGSLYYDGTREYFLQGNDRGYFITEPYVYNELNLIVEQMAPIVIRGRFMGICGVDRSLDFIFDHLQKWKPFASAELFLVSGRGNIIATTLDRELQTMPVDAFYVSRSAARQGRVITEIFDFTDRFIKKGTAEKRLAQPDVDATYIPLFEEIMNANRGLEVREFMDPLTGEKALIASAIIPTGDWRLVMTVSQDEVLGPTRKAITTSALFGLAGMTLIILLSFHFSGQIVSRIREANSLAKRVAAGDLTVETEVKANDETGELLRAIQGMVDHLNGLILQVKHATIQLVSTATRITSTAKTQESTIQDFGAATSEIAAAANQISTTSKELLKTMGDVADSSSETAELAQTGRSRLTDMGESMQGLATATRSISSRLATITEKATNINKVVSTIQKVSEQTNLLSLNAAIEAEKAGEAGLGFAVVAREIRRLADQTAAATLDIDRMVRDMQTAVSAGVMEVDKFSGEVKAGVSEVGSLSEQLNRIIEKVEELAPRFESVEEGMQSQTQGASQISEAMTNLRDGVKKTAESLQEFDQVSQSLHQSVNSLRKEVARFKVAERNSTGQTRMPFPARLSGSKKLPE